MPDLILGESGISRVIERDVAVVMFREPCELPVVRVRHRRMIAAT